MRKNKIFPLHVENRRDAGIVQIHLGDGAEIPECRPQEVVPEASPQVHARAQHEINELFRHANREHPMLLELLRLCTERRIRQLARGQ